MSDKEKKNKKRVRRSDFDSAEEWQDFKRQQREQKNRLSGDEARMMFEQSQQRFNQFNDAGLFGGIRNSPRNPGGSQNAGLDWLADGWKPEKNPYENGQINPVANAQAAVVERKEHQRANEQFALQKKHDTGVYQRPDGASEFYYNNPFGDTPDATMMPIDERYGGGIGVGGISLRQPQGALPTGSGIPMSSDAAFGVGQIGPGIYQEDRSNAYAMDAADARAAADAMGFDAAMEQFYKGRTTAEEVGRQSPEAPAPELPDYVGPRGTPGDMQAQIDAIFAQPDEAEVESVQVQPEPATAQPAQSVSDVGIPATAMLPWGPGIDGVEGVIPKMQSNWALLTSLAKDLLQPWLFGPDPAREDYTASTVQDIAKVRAGQVNPF